MFITRLILIALTSFTLCGLLNSTALAQDGYRKAIDDGEEIVLDKIFPKRKKIEISVGGGGIINQSYIQSFVVGGTINYFFSEVWGAGIEGGFIVNSDKAERTCIENFYNDFNGSVETNSGQVCSEGSDTQAQADLATGTGTGPETANMGPAYVPIRQKDIMIGGHLIWNPIYGKQLLLLSSTGYFDVFVKMGGGITMGDFFAQTKTLRDGRLGRGPPESNPGAGFDNAGNPETDANGNKLWGVEGRPDAKPETNFYVMASLGQKYHFFKKFHISLEVKNYTLLFTEDTGFDNFFTLNGGIGIRF